MKQQTLHRIAKIATFICMATFSLGISAESETVAKPAERSASKIAPYPSTPWVICETCTEEKYKLLRLEFSRSNLSRYVIFDIVNNTGRRYGLSDRCRKHGCEPGQLPLSEDDRTIIRAYSLRYSVTGGTMQSKIDVTAADLGAPPGTITGWPTGSAFDAAWDFSYRRDLTRRMINYDALVMANGINSQIENAGALLRAGAGFVVSEKPSILRVGVTFADGTSVKITINLLDGPGSYRAIDYQHEDGSKLPMAEDFRAGLNATMTGNNEFLNHFLTYARRNGYATCALPSRTEGVQCRQRREYDALGNPTVISNTCGRAQEDLLPPVGITAYKPCDW